MTSGSPSIAATKSRSRESISRSARRAVSRTVRTSARRRRPGLQDREVLLPGTHFVGVLPRHDSDHLPEMPEVVSDPGRKMLAHRDASEIGVAAALREVAV